MSSSLFQDELNYLRESGRLFAARNPKLVKYLSERSTDPDVERLMEGFAFLTSRVREKIEDEAPEFTRSLITLLWPNFLRPTPPLTMIEFNPTDRSLTEPQTVPAGSTLLSRNLGQIGCPFRTVADCLVYPIEIAGAQLERSSDHARLRIAFASLSGQPLSRIGLGDLRLTFTGDAATRHSLFLWMRRYLRSARAVFQDGTDRTIAHREAVAPIGLSPAEALLPCHNGGFEGHRLLQEYFVFPDKFCGVDIRLPDRLFADRRDVGFALEFEFARPVSGAVRLNADHIRLHCVPAANLFAVDAEPLSVRHRKTSYPLVPQGIPPEHVEIFSVDRVHGHSAGDRTADSARTRDYPAFESFDHEIGPDHRGEQVYYQHQAERSLRHPGFDHRLSFVLHNCDQALPREETLSVELTCFNRRLAAELAVGDVCIATSSSPSFVSFTNLTRPTEPVHPPLDGALYWNLVSNLSLNYLSLLDRRALAAILNAYDHRSHYNRQAARVARKRLEGIGAVDTRAVDRLFRGLPVRGLRSSITMRESHFESEGELYLFASLLSEFFSLYSTVNSFHELEVVGEENGETYQWPARIGQQPLI